ncbi:MAG: hypothetical protein BGO43_00430 [Gammaproteobacteria bacterium 39-13]|nr:MAG: hypothetical protein BGO43_00430 [Gammaproteobacteria bacterium 39-13]
MLSLSKDSNVNEEDKKRALRGKSVAVTNPLFLKAIRQFDYRKITALYQKDDLLLLKYYYDHNLAKKDKVILLQPEFYVERFAETFVNKHYLKAIEREKYLTYSAGEQFFDIDNHPLDGEYMYALLADNRLYIAPLSEVVNHSHLVAGLPVKAVGNAFFKDGCLVTLSNNSGHYKPTAEQMVAGLEWFVQNTQDPFLFEDHSQFSPTSLHYGIRHFNANDYVKQSKMGITTPPLSPDEVELQINNALQRKDQFADLEGSYDSVSENEDEMGYDNELAPISHEDDEFEIATLLPPPIVLSEDTTLATAPAKTESSFSHQYTGLYKSLSSCRFARMKRRWDLTK